MSTETFSGKYFQFEKKKKGIIAVKSKVNLANRKTKFRLRAPPFYRHIYFIASIRLRLLNYDCLFYM